MEFTATPLTPPKHAVPCLAQITLGSDGPRHSAMMALTVDASATDRADVGIITRKVYWRAAVGVDTAANALIITPLNNPPNPLLDNPPAEHTANPEQPEHDTSTFAGKIAHLFHHDHAAPVAKPVTEFPGTVDGKPLAGIRVPLAVLDAKHHVIDTASTPAYILIPVATDDPRDAATLRFEFDSWLSAKADVEILATQIHQALEAAHPHGHHGAAAAGAGAPLAPVQTQAGIRSGRDNDGSTHPSGDKEYDPKWKQAW
jgi:hypothetical protein